MQDTYAQHCANLSSYLIAEQSIVCLLQLANVCVMVKIVKTILPHTVVNVLRIHTPINDVEQQVSQRKYDSRVRVNHVAVAHYKFEILF